MNPKLEGAIRAGFRLEVYRQHGLIIAQLVKPWLKASAKAKLGSGASLDEALAGLVDQLPDGCWEPRPFKR